MSRNVLVEIHGAQYPGGLDLGISKDATASEFRERGEELLREVGRKTHASAHSITAAQGGVGRTNQEYIFCAPVDSSEEIRALHTKALKGILCLVQAHLCPTEVAGASVDVEHRNVNRQEDLKVRFKATNNTGFIDLNPQGITVSEKLQQAMNEAKAIMSSFAIDSESLGGSRNASEEVRAFCVFANRAPGNTLQFEEIERIAEQSEASAGTLLESRTLTDVMMERYGPRAQALVRGGFPASAFYHIMDNLIGRWDINPNAEQRSSIGELVARKILTYSDQLAEAIGLNFEIEAMHMLQRQVKSVMNGVGVGGAGGLR